MKLIHRILTFAIVGILTPLFGQIQPGGQQEATTTQVAAGTDHSTYVSPYGLSNGTASTNGQVLTNVSGTIQFANPPTGTLPSITGQANNTLVVNPAGTSATWVYAPVSLSNTINPRASRQGLVFDGSSGATVTSVPAFGTGDLTVAALINPSSLASYHTIIGSASYGLEISVDASGNLRFRSPNAVEMGTAATGIIAGKTQLLIVRRTAGTWSVNLNLVSASCSITDANMTVGVSAIGNGVYGAPLNPWAGYLYVWLWNRSLSTAEQLSLYEQGAPAGSDYNNASNTAINTNAWTRYSSVGTISSSTSSGYTMSEPGSSNFPSAISAPVFTVAAGQKILVGLTYTVNSGDGTNHTIKLFNSPGASDLSAEKTLTAGANTLEFTATGDSANCVVLIANGNGTACNYTVTGAAVTREGLLLAPGDSSGGSGLVWGDMSGNSATIVLPASGVTWSRPSDGPYILRGSTSTNGNQQLLGANVIAANTQIKSIRARSLSGTPAVTLGTSSGGSQIAASATLSTTWQAITIALSGGIVSSASSVWVGSNTTDTVQLNAELEPLIP